jgi:hypothetical protein
VGDQIVFYAQKNQFQVIGEDGSPCVGLDGSTLLSLDSFFADFASANKHLVRGNVLPGVGSRENQIPHPTVGEKEKLAKLFGRASDSRAANTLAINNPQEYRRFKREARSHGLIS